MSRLQVLVATMGQKDFSIAEKMNLHCDTIIANQTDFCKVDVEKRSDCTLKMISTDTIGVGINRNIALLAADSEIVLFADDDVVYYNGTLKGVNGAFDETPDADVIIFSVDIIRDGTIREKRHLQKKRLHVWNSMRFGTYVIAAKREALVQYNITFNQLFGGGCIYSSGEDSLFLKACFDNGLKVYSNDYVLGTCCKDASSWFTGCNEKYFYDKGVLMGYLFPRLKHLMIIYFALNFKKESDFGFVQRMCIMFKGLSGGKKLIPYSE